MGSTSQHWGTAAVKGLTPPTSRDPRSSPFRYLFSWSAHHTPLFALDSFSTWAEGSHLACFFGQLLGGYPELSEGQHRKAKGGCWF